MRIVKPDAIPWHETDTIYYAKGDTIEIDIDEMAVKWMNEQINGGRIRKQFSEYLQEVLK